MSDALTTEHTVAWFYREEDNLVARLRRAARAAVEIRQPSTIESLAADEIERLRDKITGLQVVLTLAESELERGPYTEGVKNLIESALADM